MGWHTCMGFLLGWSTDWSGSWVWCWAFEARRLGYGWSAQLDWCLFRALYNLTATFYIPSTCLRLMSVTGSCGEDEYDGFTEKEECVEWWFVSSSHPKISLHLAIV